MISHRQVINSYTAPLRHLYPSRTALCCSTHFVNITHMNLHQNPTHQRPSRRPPSMPSLLQWASRVYAFIVGTLMLSVGIIVFVSNLLPSPTPVSYLDTLLTSFPQLAPNQLSQNLFSFPLTSTPPSPTLYLFASRETSCGLIILTLLFTNQYRSLGLVLTCLFICGATDAYLEVSYGHGSWVEAAKVHLPFAVLGAPSIRVLLRGRK